MQLCITRLLMIFMYLYVTSYAAPLTGGPCTKDEQCVAVWPGAQCKENICICPQDAVPVNTSSSALCTVPTVCRHSSQVAIDEKTDRWIRCQMNETCPVNSICLNGTCCIDMKTNQWPSVLEFIHHLCPESSQQALNEKGNIIFCNFINVCPEKAFCQKSNTSAFGEGICCIRNNSQTQKSQCPGNDNITQTEGVSPPTACHLGEQSSCTPPHTCVYASINATDGICCLIPSEAVLCPTGMRKVWAENGHYHRQCSPLHLSTCPEDSICVYNEAYGIYYCCTKITEECPQERTPYIDPIIGKPLNCTSHCPNGFICVHDSTIAPNKICCSEHPLVSQCMVGKALTTEADIPYSCDINALCPPGYYCLNTGRDGSICCPGADKVCPLEVDFGSTCSPKLETLSFYYDSTIRTCKTFLYRGCGGNDNRFSDIDRCKAFCHLSNLDHVCSNAQIGPTEKSHIIPTVCDERDDQCPDGFICTYNLERGHFYCCPDAEKEHLRMLAVSTVPYDLSCPDGASPYTDPDLHTIRLCSPYLRFSCPSDHECLYSDYVLRYQCCPVRGQSSTQTAQIQKPICSTGMKPYRTHSSGHPIVCQPASTQEQCPALSACQYSPFYWQFICCTKNDDVPLITNQSHLRREQQSDPTGSLSMRR